MSPQQQHIIDTAYEVLVFTKTHDYPVDGTMEYQELTVRLDALESAFIAAGVSTDMRAYQVRHVQALDFWFRVCGGTAPTGQIRFSL